MPSSPSDAVQSPTVARSPRLGVTGHRPAGLCGANLDDLRGRVRLVLARLQAPGASGRAGTVVASLAEGADRLVVTEALAAGYDFVGILPFARDEFARDFATAASRDEYRALLARAATVTELAGVRAPVRCEQAAYAAAGEAMLDRSDLLLAIWDGERARGVGGTEQVVRSALGRGLPVIWIAARPPYQIRVTSVEAESTPAVWQTADAAADPLAALKLTVGARQGGAA